MDINGKVRKEKIGMQVCDVFVVRVDAMCWEGVESKEKRHT